MNRHLTLITDAAAAELAATLAHFEWAVDVLGILPDERRTLVHGPGGPGWMDDVPGLAAETTIRRIIGIADDVTALLGDADLTREWFRRPNPCLRLAGPVSPMQTPVQVMLTHGDGVRAIRSALAREREDSSARGAWC